MKNMERSNAPKHNFVIRFEDANMMKLPKVISSFVGTKEELLTMCKRTYGYQFHRIIHRTIRLMDRFGVCFISIVAND